ncbi:hypothetical protein M2263_001834 [Providencia alcalifaciens]|nr:hypothetical protein [Providencia alcalifaciens]
MITRLRKGTSSLAKELDSAISNARYIKPEADRKSLQINTR